MTRFKMLISFIRDHRQLTILRFVAAQKFMRCKQAYSGKILYQFLLEGVEHVVISRWWFKLKVEVRVQSDCRRTERHYVFCLHLDQQPNTGYSDSVHPDRLW